MRCALHVTVMSSAFFNPSFAFSSHFDTGKGTIAPAMRIAVDLAHDSAPSLPPITPPTYLLMLDREAARCLAVHADDCQHPLILCISSASSRWQWGLFSCFLKRHHAHRLCTAQHVHFPAAVWVRVAMKG